MSRVILDYYWNSYYIFLKITGDRREEGNPLLTLIFSAPLWWNLHFFVVPLTKSAVFLTILWRNFQFFHDSLTKFSVFLTILWQNSRFFFQRMTKLIFLFLLPVIICWNSRLYVRILGPESPLEHVYKMF